MLQDHSFLSLKYWHATGSDFAVTEVLACCRIQVLAYCRIRLCCDWSTGMLQDQFAMTEVLVCCRIRLCYDWITSILQDSGTGMLLDSGTGMLQDHTLLWLKYWHAARSVCCDWSTGMLQDSGTGILQDSGTGMLQDSGTGMLQDHIYLCWISTLSVSQFYISLALFLNTIRDCILSEGSPGMIMVLSTLFV